MPSVQIKRISQTQVELLIPIAPEDLREAEERAFRQLAKRAKLPGFRPGKIPRRIFEQTYGAETINEKAMQDVVPVSYAKALREHDLDPVDRPKMELVPGEPGAPAQIKAFVEVRPEIQLGTYTGLQLTSGAPDVTDEDVERSLQTLARDRATLVLVDRAAQAGDIVTIDYEGRIDGTLFEGGSAQGQTVELSEGRFIPGFATGIVGMASGETKDVVANFPADYPQRDLAGKAATFTVQLHEVKQIELPAIDDEFARSVSDHHTLPELRADIRKRLEIVAEARGRRTMASQAVEQLLRTHDFPLPQTLIDREVRGMLADVKESGAETSREEELRARLLPEAERRVKATLLLEAIAKTEKITATPAEIQSELQSMARQYGQPVERLRRALGTGVLAVADGIVRAKTLDFLVREATPAPAS